MPATREITTREILKINKAVDDAVKKCMERAAKSRGDYKYTTRLREKHGL